MYEYLLNDEEKLEYNFGCEDEKMGVRKLVETHWEKKSDEEIKQKNIEDFKKFEEKVILREIEQRKIQVDIKNIHLREVGAKHIREYSQEILDDEKKRKKNSSKNNPEFTKDSFTESKVEIGDRGNKYGDDLEQFNSYYQNKLQENPSLIENETYIIPEINKINNIIVTTNNETNNSENLNSVKSEGGASLENNTKNSQKKLLENNCDKKNIMKQDTKAILSILEKEKDEMMFRGKNSIISIKGNKKLSDYDFKIVNDKGINKRKNYYY